jgi:hypothetical protein
MSQRKRFDPTTAELFIQIRNAVERINGRLMSPNLKSTEIETLKNLRASLKLKSKNIKIAYFQAKASSTASLASNVLEKANSYVVPPVIY